MRPGEQAADHRDANALVHFLLQAARRGGDQLAGRGIQQQQHGRGIGLHDLPDLLQQSGQLLRGIHARQRRISDRLHVPQPVLGIGRDSTRRGHPARRRMR
jgi:hypothetical protein